MTQTKVTSLEDEVIEQLKALKVEWVWNPMQRTVRTTEGYCPVCALAAAKNPDYEGIKLNHAVAYPAAGLDYTTACWFADAADNASHFSKPNSTSGKLLALCSNYHGPY